jgi:hypothetical protein
MQPMTAMAIIEITFITIFAASLLIPAFRRPKITGYPTIENGVMQFNTPE